MLKEANGMKKKPRVYNLYRVVGGENWRKKNRTFKTKKIVYMQLAEKHED